MTATGDVPGRIQHSQATETVRKGLSRHFPVPSFARLATGHSPHPRISIRCPLWTPAPSLPSIAVVA